MERKKVIWVKKAKHQLFSIMDYNDEQNKSDFYSLKVEREIRKKLLKLDFSVSLPQKTSLENVYYFTYNHISILFSFNDEFIIILMVWDDRRNPKDLQYYLDKKIQLIKYLFKF